MGWFCYYCASNDNPDEQVNICSNCESDREQLRLMKPTVRRRKCYECGHMHRLGFFCHVYCYNADDDGGNDDDMDDNDDNDDENDNNDENVDVPEVVAEDDDDDEDDDLIGRKKKIVAEKEPQFAPKKKIVDSNKVRPLKTPEYIKKLKYIRCNCNLGVPTNSKFFEPVPRGYKAGLIPIQMYTEIYDNNFQADLKSRNDALEEKKENDANERMCIILPSVLRFIHLSMVANSAVVSKSWNYGTNHYQYYVDVRDMIPWQAFRAHHGQVDTLVVVGKKVYSGGDKRIIVSDFTKGEVLHVITRDSGEIPTLLHKDGDIYCGSANGSVRTYGITHNPKQMKLAKTVWEHSRTIRQIIFSLPSVGPCQIHGIDNHVCVFYTASEDRSIKAYNLLSFKPVASVTNPTLRSSTIQALTQSDRHLFAGTTSGTVLVLSKFNTCEREDIHACNTPGAIKSYCLQQTLCLPVMYMKSLNNCICTSLVCAGPNYSHSQLWSGNSIGQITLWNVPYSGLEFTPLKTWRGHEGQINAMRATFRHMISVSDDGVLLVTDLSSFMKIRSINILEWCNYRQLLPIPTLYRRIKCIDVVENAHEGGTIAIGTNYGEIIVMAIGTSV